MTLTIVSVVFGVFAIGLIVLLIYKSTLSLHRDDQLFLMTRVRTCTRSKRNY